MSKQHETVLDVGGTFQPGDKVEVHPRVVDALDGAPITKAVEKATVRQDGTVRVKGLEPHGPYLLHGTERRVQIDPGPAGKERIVEVPRNIAFNAAGDLAAHEDLRNTQAAAALVAAQHAESTRKVRQSVPDSAASAGSTGRQFTRSGAITTNQPVKTQVGAENRPGEAPNTGVEDRPAEARRKPSFRDTPTTQRDASPDERVRASDKQREAGNTASPGRPSR